MEYRKAGRTGPELSALSMGSWNTYSRLAFEAGVDLVRHAFDLGINTFDTAYYRDKPHTEVLFGRILDVVGKPRSSYKLIEKVWFFTYPDQKLTAQLDASLVRLNQTQVDVIISEHPRPGMDVKKLTEDVAELVVSGRALSWGTLNWTPQDLMVAHEHAAKKGLPGPQLAQLKYNVARCGVVDGPDYQKVFAETGMSLHASDVMEGGILAGKLQPERHIGIDTGNIREDIRAVVPRLTEIAAQFNATPAQVALAFAVMNKATASVLFGATRKRQLDDNVKALDLARNHAAELRTLLAPLAVAGHANDAPYEHSEPLKGDFVTD